MAALKEQQASLVSHSDHLAISLAMMETRHRQMQVDKQEQQLRQQLVVLEKQ
ncbi:hypothetical protein HaLaN_14928, partial [Haematococcus lacustris]